MRPTFLELRKLGPDDGRDIYEMLREIPAEESGFESPANGKSFDEYKLWLQKCDQSSKQVGIVNGWKVPQTVFWLYEDGRPVGFGKIRHFLTDALRKGGGNVGYAVRPSERGRGLGTKLLALLIVEARKIGVESLLLTVRNGNTASIRVALANGGKIKKVTEERHYIRIDL